MAELLLFLIIYIISAWILGILLKLMKLKILRDWSWSTVVVFPIIAPLYILGGASASVLKSLPASKLSFLFFLIVQSFWIIPSSPRRLPSIFFSGSFHFIYWSHWGQYVAIFILLFSIIISAYFIPRLKLNKKTEKLCKVFVTVILIINLIFLIDLVLAQALNSLDKILIAFGVFVFGSLLEQVWKRTVKSYI